MGAEIQSPGVDPTDPSPATPQDERVGIFPSWRWAYGTVVVYGVIMILFLLTLTRMLNFGAAP